MRIQYVQQLSFENCATPEELGEHLARPLAMTHMVSEDITLPTFRVIVSALLTNTDHEFTLDDTEWGAAYTAWRAACERRNPKKNGDSDASAQ